MDKKYLNLFCVPIQIIKLELDIDSLIEFCYEMKRKNKKGVERSNMGGWQSNNVINETHTEFVKLKNKIKDAAKIYHEEMKFKKTVKQEIDNIKPELQQFLDNNGFQMQLDDPNTYNKNEMEALANHINLNLTTPKIQSLLNDIGASMNKKVTIIAPSLTGYIYGTF